MVSNKKLDRQKWIKENQKYMKGAFVLTILFVFILFLFGMKLPKEKTLKDKFGQKYKELVYQNRIMKYPVFQDKLLNKEIKKYKKNVWNDQSIKNLSYQVETAGNMEQIIWTKQTEKEIHKDFWIYDRKQKKAIHPTELFHHWNEATENHIETLLYLETERMIRTLTPPIQENINEQMIQDMVKKAVKEKNFYLVNQKTDSNLYFELPFQPKKLKVGIPLYQLKDDLNLELLGIKNKKETLNVWFQNQNQGRKLVAFTYDDGPNPNTTPGLLQELKKRSMTATFFMLGKNVERNAPLVKTMHTMGFDLASHTFNHRNLKRITNEEQAVEINGTVDAIKNATGIEPSSTRPPYGNYNEVTLSLLKNPIVLWNVDTLDWKYRNVDMTYQNSIDKIDDGDIVLFHDIYKTSVDASLKIADELYKRGYIIMSVKDLARAKNKTLETGVKYYSIH